MKIRKIITNNFGIKLTVFFISIFVWILISGKVKSYSERSFEIDVGYINHAQNIAVRNVNPEKVKITVKGTRKNIDELVKEDFKIEIDMKGISKSDIISRLVEDCLQYPQEIEVVSFHPKWIEVNIEEFISKEVPVKIRYSGKPKRGLKLNKKFSPRKIIIYGYKSRITNINYVYTTKNIDLSGITKTTKIISPLDKGQEILRFDGPDQVEIIIEVQRKNGKRGKK